MSEKSKIKKRSECGGVMEKGRSLVSYSRAAFTKKGDWFGNRITPFMAKTVISLSFTRK